jgi:hypothetical protein
MPGISDNTTPLGTGSVGTGNPEIKSYVGRMLETEISRGAYRQNRFNDLQLGKLRASLYSLVSTWPTGDKQNIISQYGDASRLPQQNSKDYVEMLNEQLVETLIIRLPANELNALEGKAKTVQTSLTKQIDAAQKNAERRNSRYVNLNTMQDTYAAVTNAKSASQVVKAIKAKEPGFKLPRGIAGQYGRLRRELVQLLNGQNNVELANTALGVGIDFPEGTRRPDIIDMICNQVILYVATIEGKTRGGISSRVAGAVGDNINKILELTSFSFIAGKDTMSQAELKKKREEARQAQKRMKERERQLTKRSATFGTDFESLAGTKGGWFFGRYKAMRNLQNSDNSVLAGMNTEELRNVADRYGVDWTRYQDNDKRLEVEILRAMAADKRRGRTLEGAEERSKFGMRRAGPGGLMRLPTFNRTAGRAASDQLSAYKSITGISSKGGFSSLKDAGGVGAASGTSNDAVIHLDDNGKPDADAINYAMAVYVVGQGVAGKLVSDKDKALKRIAADKPDGYSDAEWAGMTEKEKIAAKKKAKRSEANGGQNSWDDSLRMFLGLKTRGAKQKDNLNMIRSDNVAKTYANLYDAAVEQAKELGDAAYKESRKKGASRKEARDAREKARNASMTKYHEDKGNKLLAVSSGSAKGNGTDESPRVIHVDVKGGVGTAVMDGSFDATPVWILGGYQVIGATKYDTALSPDKLKELTDKMEAHAISGMSLEGAKSEADKDSESDKEFEQYQKDTKTHKKQAGGFYFNHAAKKLGFKGVLGYNVNGNTNKPHQNDALAVFITNGFTEYISDDLDARLQLMANMQSSIYSYLSTSLPVMFAGLQEAGLTFNAASAGAAATLGIQTVIDTAIGVIQDKMNKVGDDIKVQRYAKGGTGHASSNFIAGDSEDGSQNQEMVSIDWAKRKFKVKPIPQIRGVQKYANGGTGDASDDGGVSNRTTMGSSERNSAMGVSIVGNLVTYSKQLSDVRDDGSGKAIKVYSVNPSFADEIDYNGTKVSVIGIMAGMLEKLGSLESIMTSGTQIMSSVASNTAATASAIKSSGSQSSSSSSGGFPSSLDSILQGK